MMQVVAATNSASFPGCSFLESSRLKSQLSQNTVLNSTTRSAVNGDPRPGKEFLSVAITTRDGGGSLLPLQSVGGYSRKLRLRHWRYWREGRWFCCHLLSSVSLSPFVLTVTSWAIIWVRSSFFCTSCCCPRYSPFPRIKHGAVYAKYE